MPQPPNKKSHLTAKVLDFVDIHPSQIQHLHYCARSGLLYIARRLYSEVYTVSIGDSAKGVGLEQIMVLEPCERIYEIGGCVVMVFAFQVKVCANGQWTVHPFTTQLLPLSTQYNSKTGKLFTFHTNQCRQWTISEEDGVDIKHLSKQDTPFYVDAEGALQGYGKRIKPSDSKASKFTTVEGSECGKYLFVGSDKGHLHVYETRFLTHIKTFHRHQGAILSIISEGNVCYFTGSDSKISSLVYVQGEAEKSGIWTLSKQVRGQSHDILSLTKIDSFLASGGITTDICFYSLTQSQTLTEQWSHKISYSSIKQCQFVNSYLVVNKFSSFQTWKMGQPRLEKQGQMEEEVDGKDDVELLVKYQVAFYKNIREILVKEYQGGLMLFVWSQEQANLWTFDQENGLVKLLTVKNAYNLACWYRKDSILTLRDGHRLELFNYTNGNIRELTDTEVIHPTDLKLCAKSGRVLIGSKYSREVEVYQITKQESPKKSIKRTIKLTLDKSYNILDICYYNPLSLMVKYQNDREILEIDKKGNQVSIIVKLPLTKIRYYGWINFKTVDKVKAYWYAVSQGKIVIVSRMKTMSKDKKIRVKQMPRIADVVTCNSNQDWNIGVIPFNFGKMIQEQIMPIMTKKIL